MFAAFRIIRREDQTVMDEPVNLNLNIEEAREIQHYLNSGEIPLKVRSEQSNELEKIRFVLLDPNRDYSFKSVNSKALFLHTGKYNYEISVYNYAE